MSSHYIQPSIYEYLLLYSCALNPVGIEEVRTIYSYGNLCNYAFIKQLVCLVACSIYYTGQKMHGSVGACADYGLWSIIKLEGHFVCACSCFHMSAIKDRKKFVTKNVYIIIVYIRTLEKKDETKYSHKHLAFFISKNRYTLISISEYERILF